MQGIYETVTTAVRKSIGQNTEQIVQFLPNLISAFLILLIGWVIAKISEKVFAKLLKSLKVDEVAEKRGIDRMLREIGVKRSTSAFCGRILYGVLLLLFLIPALETLRLEYVSLVMAGILAYIPNLVAALLIFLIGLTVAKIIAASVGASAKSAGLEYASVIGLFVKYFLTLVVLILGLAQLGIQTDILTIIFAVMVTSLGLAVALSLGLGSRTVVSNILAGAFASEHFAEGKEIEVQGIKGTVLSIGSVTTTIESEGRVITVPNAVLIENVIE